MRKNPTFPAVKGEIEISHGPNGIFIAGDRVGLRSLIRQLRVLADLDPDAYPNIPIGERYHTHLHPGYQLSRNSTDTELCRLDAKGTGTFPKTYRSAQPRRRGYRR